LKNHGKSCQCFSVHVLGRGKVSFTYKVIVSGIGLYLEKQK
jgi:hypothetical protein